MPLLGAHMSAAGGPHRALLRGKEAGCRVVQVFTRGTSRWDAPPLNEEEVERFHRVRGETGVECVAAHVSYLINLASPREDLWERSLAALEDEMERAERLGIPFLVMHPGSHMGGGVAAGLKRVAAGLHRVLQTNAASSVKIILETTAGQGTGLGYRFEHLARIMDAVEMPGRLGVCLDTCHVFAAGYDFRGAARYGAMMKTFARCLGDDQPELFHVNDSKREPGSRVDRHAHMGQGLIGLRGIARFLRDPMFQDKPFILETPKQKDAEGQDMDVVNLRKLKQLVR